MGFSGFNATHIKNNSGHGNLKNTQIALSVRVDLSKRNVYDRLLLNSKCFKCAKKRFHCANGMMVLRNYAAAHLRGNAGWKRSKHNWLSYSSIYRCHALMTFVKVAFE